MNKISRHSFLQSVFGALNLPVIPFPLKNRKIPFLKKYSYINKSI